MGAAVMHGAVATGNEAVKALSPGKTVAETEGFVLGVCVKPVGTVGWRVELESRVHES